MGERLLDIWMFRKEAYLVGTLIRINTVANFVLFILCFQDNGMTVACHSSGKMVVTIDLIVMPFIDYTRTHLNSESCIGALDDTNLIIETSLAACETVSSQNATHVKYQNNVFSYVIDVFPWITRMYNMKLPFYCIFPRINLHVHNGIYLDPRKGVVTLEDGE